MASKVLSFYPVPYYDGTSYAQIKVELRTKNDGQYVLSMQGQIGGRNGSSGQCYEEIMDTYNKAPKQKQFELLQKICAVWERWHLNDLRAGTPRQMAALRELKKSQGKIGDYDAQLKYLESRNLVEDNGYKYGSAWLFEPLPQDVLNFIQKLIGIPETQAAAANTGHISFSQGSSGMYESSLKGPNGKPLYLINKNSLTNGKSMWCVMRQGESGQYDVWVAPASSKGWDKQLHRFTTLNDARAAVNMATKK